MTDMAPIGQAIKLITPGIRRRRPGFMDGEETGGGVGRFPKPTGSAGTIGGRRFPPPIYNTPAGGYQGQGFPTPQQRLSQAPPPPIYGQPGGGYQGQGFPMPGGGMGPQVPLPPPLPPARPPAGGRGSIFDPYYTGPYYDPYATREPAPPQPPIYGQSGGGYQGQGMPLPTTPIPGAALPSMPGQPGLQQRVFRR